jgi:hypothetical protein
VRNSTSNTSGRRRRIIIKYIIIHILGVCSRSAYAASIAEEKTSEEESCERRVLDEKGGVWRVPV